MAKHWEVSYKRATALFTLSKITRANLYGARKRFPIDSQGRTCSTAVLTRDGRYVLPAGSIASLYLDEAGEVVERGDMVGEVEEELGFNATHDAPVEVDPAVVLDHTITHTYALDPVTIPPVLDAALSSGKVFQSTLQFKSGRASHTAFLLKSRYGYFLLLGAQHGFDFVAMPDADCSPPDQDEDDIEDIDFTMQ